MLKDDGLDGAIERILQQVEANGRALAHLQETVGTLVELAAARTGPRQQRQAAALAATFRDEPFGAGDMIELLRSDLTSRVALRLAFGERSAKSIGRDLAALAKAGHLRRTGTGRPPRYVLSASESVLRLPGHHWRI